MAKDGRRKAGGGRGALKINSVSYTIIAQNSRLSLLYCYLDLRTNHIYLAYTPEADTTRPPFLERKGGLG